MWDDVVYQPGTLEVVTYKNGSEWARDTMATTGEPARLLLEPDRTIIIADGRDLCYVTVKITDSDGRIVPRSNPLIAFTIDGPADIIATANGNATDHTSFQDHQRKAYNGLCLVIVR